MLSDLLDESLVALNVEASDWEDAIRKSAQEPVEFGSADNDPVKFLFPLSAKDSDSHLSALQSLVELLSDPDFFAQLESAATPKDVVDLVHAKEGK